MSFEKYGNKLINLLSRLENKLDPTDVQIGGADPTGAENIYVKELSAGSVLVHLEKDGNNASVLEKIGFDGKYSDDQQLRLGCDNEGNMYKYSVVLTLHPKKEPLPTLKNKCNTALYGRAKPDDNVQTKCQVSEYSNDHENSIEYIKKEKKIINTKFVEKVAEETLKVIKEKTTYKEKKIAVLGPVEDILGFFIKYVSKKKNDAEFKNFIILSVKDEIWSTDFNYDFINCSINTDENDKDNFNQLNPELPIVLVNVGNKSVVEGHNPDELLDKLPRVTRCEIEWIRQKIEGTSYKWETVKREVNGKTVWINILKKTSGTTETDDAKTALGELSEGLRKLAAAAEATSQ